MQNEHCAVAIRPASCFDARMENITPPPGSAPNNPPTPASVRAEQSWCLWCHLSALGGLVLPVVGNILGPLLIWQLKRGEFPAVDAHGREALNFQLSMLIYFLAALVMMFASSFFCLGWRLFPALVAIPVLDLILTLIGGIKAGSGELYRYPLSLRLVR
jgi:uncharacterized protein